MPIGRAFIWEEKIIEINQGRLGLEEASRLNTDLVESIETELEQSPKVDRKLLTPAQIRERNREIGSNAAANASRAAGVKGLVEGGSGFKPGKAAGAAAKGAATSLATSAAKDGYDTARGNTSQNTGSYAPDLSNQRVVREVVDRIEKGSRGDYNRASAAKDHAITHGQGSRTENFQRIQAEQARRTRKSD